VAVQPRHLHRRLAFYERYREGAALKLKPPARIFLDKAGAPLRLAARAAGGSGRRKIDVIDWDGDGRLDIIMGAEDGFFDFFDRRYIEKIASRATLPGEGRLPKP
jgi:hypothetical protein